MIRTYNLKHNTNKGKQVKAAATVRLYRFTAYIIAAAQWYRFYKEGKSFWKNLEITHIPSLLSERYKQTCQYQVVSILNSFISNRKNDFSRIVMMSSLSEQTRIDLLTINKYGWWHRKELKKINMDTLMLARKIFNHILSSHRRPGFKKISLHLDRKVALISGKVSDKATQFDYWVRLSTVEKNNPVYIPIETNPYFESIEGKKKNFCQIGLKDDGSITVSFIKDVPDKKDTYTPLIGKLPLDLGLKTLFATDKGDLCGKRFYETLLKFDARITSLTSNRQRQGLKVKSKKYDKAAGKLRAYLKNEICRCLNRLVELYKPAEVVVERLDFRNPNLSKRFNRLISRFGKSQVNAKLKSLSEEYGIVIVETNASYSSKECSVCGYVDKDNRKTQGEFECKFCSTGLHADVNAARVHLARSSCKVTDIYKSKKAVLHILVRNFLSTLSDMERKFCMPCSKAMGLLSGNPYFRKVLHSPKGFCRTESFL